MLGHIVLGGAGRRVRLTEETAMGLRLLRAQVPLSRRDKTLTRRVYRAGNALWEWGVNRVLVCEDFPAALWEPLRRAGLRGVEVESLCQSAAVPLILALLQKQGRSPAKAAVCLQSCRAFGAVQRTAEGLAPHVARLVIDCPSGGEELGEWLRDTYGIPLTRPGAVQTHVSASFSPERAQKADLRLYGSAPYLCGLNLSLAEGELPPGFEPLPLLAVLAEEGKKVTVT